MIGTRRTLALVVGSLFAGCSAFEDAVSCSELTCKPLTVMVGESIDLSISCRASAGDALYQWWSGERVADFPDRDLFAPSPEDVADQVGTFKTPAAGVAGRLRHGFTRTISNTFTAGRRAEDGWLQFYMTNTSGGPDEEDRNVSFCRISIRDAGQTTDGGADGPAADSGGMPDLAADGPPMDSGEGPDAVADTIASDTGQSADANDSVDSGGSADSGVAADGGGSDGGGSADGGGPCAPLPACADLGGIVIALDGLVEECSSPPWTESGVTLTITDTPPEHAPNPCPATCDAFVGAIGSLWFDGGELQIDPSALGCIPGLVEMDTDGYGGSSTRIALYDGTALLSESGGGILYGGETVSVGSICGPAPTTIVVQPCMHFLTEVRLY